MIFIVTNKATGEEVSRYASAGLYIGEWPLDAFDHTEVIETPAEPDTRVYGGRRLLTKLEFVVLLGMPAYVALLGMARQSVEVEAFVKLIDWATPDKETGYSIDLDDPRMAQLAVLEPALIAQNAATAGWASEVLNG